MFRALALIAAAGLGGVSCTALGQLNLLSTQQEVEIGEQAAPRDRALSPHLPRSDRPRLRGQPGAGAGAPLPANGHYLSYQGGGYDEVNAFAVPGGWLYVNLG